MGSGEDSSEYYTYIHDPDGNMIELVYHGLGLEDTEGKQVDGGTQCARVTLAADSRLCSNKP